MLDDTDKGELLRIARDTLEGYFSTGRIPGYGTDRPGLLARRGAFVTLHRDEELRGCIGQITADCELYRVVQHCSVSAAVEDVRFDPVTKNDLPFLTIEISVLSPLQKIAHVSEIEVGRHGLLLSRGMQRGLLLPQVATEYRWNREQFLAHTCRKAGLPDGAWHDPRAAIQVFTAVVFSEPAAAAASSR